MNRSLKIAGGVAAAALLGGCATMKLDAGFADVGAAVEQRAAIKVVWNSGSDLDGDAARKLRALLTNKLDVDAAVQIALLNNRELQAAYSDLGVAQADLVQAGLLKNPIFDAAITFPASGRRPDLELTAVMNFLDIFYVPLRKRVAAARFEETKLRLTGSILDFAGRVRAAFYRHQADEQMLELRQTVARALAAAFEFARRQHEAGNISDLDFVKQRASYESAKLALRSAEAAAAQSREEMNVLMGAWGDDTGWEIETRLPEARARDIEPAEIEKTAVGKSLELASAKQRIVAAGEQLGLAQSLSLIPELGLGARGERQAGSWSAGPFVEMPIPIFDQGQGRMGRSAAELRRAQQEYYAMAVRIRAAARATLERLTAARDRALYLKDILLPVSERVVQEAQLHYNAMQIGVFDLLRARERQIDAGAAYVEALRDYALADADLTQLANGRLPAANATAASKNAAIKSGTDGD